MKKRIKTFVAGLLIGATVATTAGAFAYTEYIEAVYNNIKIVVNGKQISTNKQPFISSGTTYLPVRDVAEAVDMNVSWNGSTNTVSLTSKNSNGNSTSSSTNEEVYLMDVCPPYDGYCMSIDDFKMGGKTYEGFSLHYNGYALINLDGKYSSINMDMGSVSGWDKYDEFDVIIYLDNKKNKTYTIDPKDLPQNVTIATKGVNQLKIETKNLGFNSYAGFGNITLKR